jgi:hypothetical protein
MKEVVIIGRGMGWKSAPPITEKECWGLCQTNVKRPVSLIIDMNDYTLWGKEEADLAIESRKMAIDSGIPYIDLSNYPLAEIVDEFKTDYFSNTVDYAIALAIYRGYQKIDFYGVNMETNSEWAFEKPGVDYWCGLAMGRGIEINVHGESSTILKTRDCQLYGYGFPQFTCVNRI